MFRFRIWSTCCRQWPCARTRLTFRCVSHHTFLKFIYLKSRVTGIKIFLLLVYSFSGHNSQGWAKLNLEARSSMHVSHVHGDWGNRTLFSCFPSNINREPDQNPGWHSHCCSSQIRVPCVAGSRLMCCITVPACITFFWRDEWLVREEICGGNLREEMLCAERETEIHLELKVCENVS